MNHPATALDTLTEKLVARKEGAIGWIIFNNPARHNAVSLEMWQALPVVLKAYMDDPEVRVIILRGEGEKRSWPVPTSRNSRRNAPARRRWPTTMRRRTR